MRLLDPISSIHDVDQEATAVKMTEGRLIDTQTESSVLEMEMPLSSA